MRIIHWFRRDLRLADNTALHQAAADAKDSVIPVFIFDDAILKHPDCGGPIVQFMLGCLAELKTSLQKAGGDLVLLHGKPVEELSRLVKKTAVEAIYFNRDYYPDALKRDQQVEKHFARQNVAVRSFKDAVVFEKDELLTASHKPYTVYSPYRNAWLKEFAEMELIVRGKPKLKFPASLKEIASVEMPTVQSLGFEPLKDLAQTPGESAAHHRLIEFCKTAISQYRTARNRPALSDGSSKLSAHLRIGTLSPRQMIQAALRATDGYDAGAATWISELIWRDFYQQVLFHFPHVVNHAFKKHLDRLPWRKDKKEFALWCQGRTGFPIVDAAMRQLNQTGWMHNRLRMIVAMFLTKDLRIDYRWGERYFARHLIDFETSQNNGGWQWCASTGTDAQPYFRIFNPTTQSKTCDPEGTFIKQFLPELAAVPGVLIHEPARMPAEMQKRVGCRIGIDYPAPMVDHATARMQTLAMFKNWQDG